MGALTYYPLNLPYQINALCMLVLQEMNSWGLAWRQSYLNWSSP